MLGRDENIGQYLYESVCNLSAFPRHLPEGISAGGYIQVFKWARQEIRVAESSAFKRSTRRERPWSSQASISAMRDVWYSSVALEIN
jgi:hypothetical protein